MIIVEKTEYRAIWGSLKEICKIYNFPYHSLKDKAYPIKINSYILRKVTYKTK